jgi:hypothetical protein
MEWLPATVGPIGVQRSTHSGELRPRRSNSSIQLCGSRLPELRWLKTGPLLESLRQEPRFQAIERVLNFPN